MHELTTAGLDGIDQEMELEEPFVGDAYVGKKLREVPKTLREAIETMTKSKMLACLLALPFAPAAAQAEDRPPPKLIVAISVDQFSADLFAQYRQHFTGGLKRLSEGIVFPSGYQSHNMTETCPGHSTCRSWASAASGSSVPRLRRICATVPPTCVRRSSPTADTMSQKSGQQSSPACCSASSTDGEHGRRQSRFIDKYLSGGRPALRGRVRRGAAGDPAGEQAAAEERPLQ